MSPSAGVPRERSGAVDVERMRSTLHLTASLLGTASTALRQGGPDPLGAVDSAAVWLRSAVAGFSEARGVTPPPLPVTASALRRLRVLREGLLERYDGVGRGAAPPGGALADVPIVVVMGTPATVVPRGAGIAWVESAVAVETLEAQNNGWAGRLRICHGRGCGVVFFDGSRNNSRVWHDVAVCGNAENARAFRARVRERKAVRDDRGR